jgi:hypothetical protein
MDEDSFKLLAQEQQHTATHQNTDEYKGDGMEDLDDMLGNLTDMMLKPATQKLLCGMCNGQVFFVLDFEKELRFLFHFSFYFLFYFVFSFSFS